MDLLHAVADFSFIATPFGQLNNKAWQRTATQSDPLFSFPSQPGLGRNLLRSSLTAAFSVDVRNFHRQRRKSRRDEHRKVFNHVGLLVIEPPGTTGLLSIYHPTTSLASRNQSHGFQQCHCKLLRGKGNSILPFCPYVASLKDSFGKWAARRRSDTYWLPCPQLKQANPKSELPIILKTNPRLEVIWSPPTYTQTNPHRQAFPPATQNTGSPTGLP